MPKYYYDKPAYKYNFKWKPQKPISDKSKKMLDEFIVKHSTINRPKGNAPQSNPAHDDDKPF